MKKLKIGRILAAAAAAVLLIGGIIFLTKDGAAQKIKEKNLEPYMPKPIVLQVLDNAAEESEMSINPSCSDEILTEETVYAAVPNAVSDSIPDEVKAELMGTVQSLNMAYPNAIGWIYLPNTAINYPIMQSDDNDFYLHHAYDGSSLKAGSVFLDYRYESRFMNNLNILYGHNMKNGSMFAGVTYFKDKSYFDTHRYGWLITADSVNRIDFFSVAVTDWHDEIYDGFQQLSDRMPHIREISRIYEEMSVSDSDRILMLSTCSYEFQNARTILIGRIMEEF